MGWETRRGRGRYYTRSRREGGRVVREYVGTGPIAELAAQADALHRQLRAVERAQRQAVRMLAAPPELQRLDRLVMELYRASLLVAGYHQHARGAWRRRRPR